MYTLLALAAILAGLLPRAAVAQATIEPDPRYQEVARALTGVIEQQRAEHKIPAVSVALVDGSRVVWARGFGWADSTAGVPATAETV
ncbi:MAG: serine hydrolase, partial [Gemmatimonadales bacterium]